MDGSVHSFIRQTYALFLFLKLPSLCPLITCEMALRQRRGRCIQAASRQFQIGIEPPGKKKKKIQGNIQIHVCIFLRLVAVNHKYLFRQHERENPVLTRPVQSFIICNYVFEFVFKLFNFFCEPFSHAL